MCSSTTSRPKISSGADAAVVAALRRGEAGRREAERAAVLHERVLLLDAEQQLVLRRTSSRSWRERRGCWSGAACRRRACTSHITSMLSPPRIGSGQVNDRLEHAVALVAGGLIGARAVEAPDRQLRRRPRGSWSSSAASASARCRRSRCIQPCKPQLSSIRPCAGCVRGYRDSNLDVGCRSRPMAGGIVAASGCRVVAPL